MSYGWVDVPTDGIREGIVFSGRLHVEVESTVSGLVVFRETVENTITNAGLNQVRDMILGELAKHPRAIAAGTDDGTLLVKAATNTALGAESIRKVIARRDESDKRAKMQILLSNSDGNGVTYQEAGLFRNLVEGSGGDVMFSRAFHTAISKTALNQITYTWQYDLAGS